MKYPASKYAYAATESVQDLRDKETSQGASLLVPTSNELFIDIDSEEQLLRFTNAIHHLATENKGVWTLRIRETTISKSGAPHQHIIVTLPQLFDLETAQQLARIALQYFLGSDPRCENMNVRRALAVHPIPICFFDPNAPVTTVAPRSPGYAVQGDGPFPVQLLKTNKAWPRSDEDYRLMLEPRFRSFELESDLKPDHDLWKHHGWLVIATVAPEEAPTTPDDY